MGESALTTTRGDVLACIGLGSCIGLVLVDRGRSVAAMAHVMLPEASRPGAGPASKFADLAVDALYADVTAAGALKARLEALVIGGAAMFALGGGSGQDIGARNETGVRAGLDRLGIPVRKAATGGSKGRTVRVTLAAMPSVVVREAGGQEEHLMGAAAAA